MHSKEVPYEKLLSKMFQLNAGYFLIQCACEEDKEEVYRLCGQYSREDADGVAQVCFMGVINPLTPEVETAEQVRDRLVTAAKHIPVGAPGRDRRLRVLAVQPRPQAQARLAGLRPRHRDAEDLRAPRGRADGVGGARRLDRPRAAGPGPRPDPPPRRWMPSVIDTDHYIRFERVDAVEETARGLLAGSTASNCASTSSPTTSCASRSAAAGRSTRRRRSRSASTRWPMPSSSRSSATTSVVRLRTSALVVSLWLDPFRLDVHRTDGTRRRRDGRRRRRAATGRTRRSNDAFTVRRRCRPEDAIYGLGEKTGRHNRRGRDFTLWNTDVLDPRRDRGVHRRP